MTARMASPHSLTFANRLFHHQFEYQMNQMKYRTSIAIEQKFRRFSCTGLPQRPSPPSQTSVRAMELNVFSVFCICIGLVSNVQSEKSPLPWNREALVDGGCRYRQPDVVRCLDSMRGSRNQLKFAFMGDSRVRQMFFSSLEVPHQCQQSR